MLICRLAGGDTIHHYKKAVVILFSGKRHVISTGPDNGGYREDLQAVFNHDANPGPGMACVMRDATYEGHMNTIAREDLGLDPARCSGLCTAADMENAAIRTLTFRDLSVTAVVTAGVDHNGGRAGDPATFYEDDEKFSSLPLQRPGTVNILLHINASLDGGTLARTIMTATEAKTAVLQELLVRSRYSPGLATGSGTDGIISICNPESSLKLTNAGTNSKLGELIGRTVKEALKEALYRQTGLCPDRQRDAVQIMSRFGVDEDRLWEAWRQSVPAQSVLTQAIPASAAGSDGKAAFMDRLDRVKKMDKPVRTALQYAHVMDLLEWGMLRRDEAEEITAELTGNMAETGKESDSLVSRFVNYILAVCGAC